jgi:hypothetical protein
MKYKPKTKKFERVCVSCDNVFYAGDVKAKFCLDCKKPRSCLCGCSTMVKTPGRQYAKNHSKRGKTYIEIYGTDAPTCGYQRGDSNIAKREDIRRKISDGVKRSYTDDLKSKRRDNCYWLSDRYVCYARKFTSKNGDKFRSRFEVEVADFLCDNNYSYEYERKVVMKDGHYKLVDFVVGDVHIEVTGFAFDSWKKHFIEKIKRLSESINNNPIVIISYNKNIEELSSVILENQIKNTILIEQTGLEKLKNIL